MDAHRTNGFATRAIHLGYDPSLHDGSLTPPLHLTSTFAFDTVEQGAAIFAARASHRRLVLDSTAGAPRLLRLSLWSMLSQ